MTQFSSLHAPKALSKVIKIVVVGNSGVGKTSCLRRFIDNTFSDQHRMSIGITVYEKPTSEILGLNCSLDDDYLLQFWDMNSQQYYAYIRREFYFKCLGVIFVADVTDEQSIIDLNYWLLEVAERTTPASSVLPQKILLLNKIDLLNKETIPDAHRAAIPEKLRSTVFESSAKNNVGITDGIIQLVNHIISAKQAQKQPWKTPKGPFLKKQLNVLENNLICNVSRSSRTE